MRELASIHEDFTARHWRNATVSSGVITVLLNMNFIEEAHDNEITWYEVVYNQNNIAPYYLRPSARKLGGFVIRGEREYQLLDLIEKFHRDEVDPCALKLINGNITERYASNRIKSTARV